MRALTFHGKRDVRVDEVPDPAIQDPTDAIVRIPAAAGGGAGRLLNRTLNERT